MSQTSSGKTVMVQGRIVWVAGDLFKGKQRTDDKTRQPIMNADGTPSIEYGFGLAVPKSALQQGQPGYELWAAMHEEAAQIFPSRQYPPAFAWKYKDGDGVDHNGAPFSQREGHAGHIVFALTTRIPIKFFRHENGANIMINEGIKCGDYVQVQVQVKAHGAVGQGKPGLYLNPLAALFLGYGKEIVNTPSGDQIFGTQAPQIPVGASATPIAPTNAPLVPTQQYGQPAATPSPIPGFGAASVPQQPAVQPYYNVIPPTHQPQPVATAQPQNMPMPAGIPPFPGQQQ